MICARDGCGKKVPAGQRKYCTKMCCKAEVAKICRGRDKDDQRTALKMLMKLRRGDE